MILEYDPGSKNLQVQRSNATFVPTFDAEERSRARSMVGQIYELVVQAFLSINMIGCSTSILGIFQNKHSATGVYLG